MAYNTFDKANNKGFTLLELLIAMTIITSALVMGMSFIKKSDNVIKKTFRQLVALNRQLDHFARLKRKTWRLVVHISDKKSSWWVEKKIEKDQMPAQVVKKGDQTFPPDGFIIDEDFFKEPQQLPRRLTFESVELSAHKEPVTQGKAYIYYFPEGRFSLALIKIKGRKAYWSLFIDRLHGELTVFNGNKKLKDFEQ